MESFLRRDLQQPDDDLHLIRRIKHGDQQAANEFQQKYDTTLGDFLANIGCPEIFRDDCKQQAFIVVSKPDGEFRGESSVKTYLFRIAQNIWSAERERIDRRNIAHQQWARLQSPYDRSSEPEVVLECQDLAKATEQAKSRLSHKRRQAFELVIESGLSRIEAAKKAGCSYSAFRQRLHDARASLKSMLGRFCMF